VTAPWRIVSVETTASTNADVVQRARAGEVEGLVLVAGEQTAGRGRLDRQWVSPPGAGLTFSVLLRPSLSADRLGWLPLLAGVAVAQALQPFTAAAVYLKWPNDVMTDRGKLAGLLAERVDPAAVVLGVGINVRVADRPAGATALADDGAEPELGEVLDGVVSSLRKKYVDWMDSGYDVRPEYGVLCRTIGAWVQVLLPGGDVVVGEAVDVDDTGRLMVRSGGKVRAFASGDVTHVRAARA
jgi:BirA family biotin operon repressor/biotin-[acetyl-CoA-carboxylase] ligase